MCNTTTHVVVLVSTFILATFAAAYIAESNVRGNISVDPIFLL